MTGTEIMLMVRKRINDTAGSDPTDADSIPWINEYTRNIWFNRADSRIDDNGLQRTMTEITALGDTLDLSDRFKLDIMNGLAGEFLMWKARNKENQERAANWIVLYRESIGVR
jgi:hypothetical protein